MKTLSLSIPKANIQPPPTRAEIIDAMTRVRIEQLIAENKAEVEAREILEKEIQSEIEAFALANIATLAKEVHWSQWSKSCEGSLVIRASENQLPKTLKSKMKKCDGMASRIRKCDFKEVRKEVYAAANKIVPHDERVTALLNDEASKKGLEKMLAAIL